MIGAIFQGIIVCWSQKTGEMVSPQFKSSTEQGQLLSAKSIFRDKEAFEVVTSIVLQLSEKWDSY